jgi:hypothetical protein
MANEYKSTRISEQGFVLPDLDFGSSDAIVSVDNPAFTLHSFDPAFHLNEVICAFNRQDAAYLCRELVFLKAAIIEKGCHITDFLQEADAIGRILFKLITRSAPERVLYDALCTLTAWSGLRVANCDIFAQADFVLFLVEIAVVSLSSTTFDGDRRIGRAAVAVLRNLLFVSNPFRILFVESKVLTLFCTLYSELTDYPLKECIIWLIQNVTLIDPKPPISAFAPILEFLTPVFGCELGGAEASELRLACAYIECGGQFACQFLQTVDLDNLTSSFFRMATNTQVVALNLLQSLLTCSDPEIAGIASPHIHWGKIVHHLPSKSEKKVQKKILDMVYAIFCNDEYAEYISDLCPAVMALVERATISVRSKAIGVLAKMVHARSQRVLDAIIGHRLISSAVKFLETDWSSLLKLGIDILLFVVQYALDGKCIRTIRKELGATDVLAAIEEVCGREAVEDRDDDTMKMADLLREKLNQLMEFPEKTFWDDIGEEEDEWID